MLFTAESEKKVKVSLEQSSTEIRMIARKHLTSQYILKLSEGKIYLYRLAREAKKLGLKLDKENKIVITKF